MPRRPLDHRALRSTLRAASLSPAALILPALMVAAGPTALFAQGAGTYTFRMEVGGQTMGTEVVHRSPVGSRSTS